MSVRSVRSDPYENAPRLPPAETAARVELASVVRGAWFEIEIGPGPKAGFLIERAMAVPQAALLGLEIRKKWATAGDEHLAKAGHAARARVLCEDARLALGRLGPDHCVRRAFVLFPDPWWKKRHHKRLLMGEVFLNEMARLLEPGGELFVQTDVDERRAQYEHLVLAHGAFEPAGDQPCSPVLLDNPYHARSPREHRAIADGLPVYRLRFRRLNLPPT
ncbi:MAG: tRNA (guanine-N7)-methyltransferase [Polyangiaceae bacterium]|nr:tRNA (guanine-N7)-methyltransferase [Polyangiaceae bacterium]